jgi:hypothetical protein
MELEEYSRWVISRGGPGAAKVFVPYWHKQGTARFPIDKNEPEASSSGHYGKRTMFNTRPSRRHGPLALLALSLVLGAPGPFLSAQNQGTYLFLRFAGESPGQVPESLALTEVEAEDLLAEDGLVPDGGDTGQAAERDGFSLEAAESDASSGAAEAAEPSLAGSARPTFRASGGIFSAGSSFDLPEEDGDAMPVLFDEDAIMNPQFGEDVEGF